MLRKLPSVLVSFTPMPTYAIFLSFFKESRTESFIFNKVIAFFATFLLNASTSLFRSCDKLSVFTYPVLLKPKLYFANNTFLTRLSISTESSTLFEIAFCIFWIDVGTSPGRQSISLPAINDCTAASPGAKYFATPCISSASVKDIP